MGSSKHGISITDFVMHILAKDSQPCISCWILPFWHILFMNGLSPVISIKQSKQTSQITVKLVILLWTLIPCTALHQLSYKSFGLSCRLWEGTASWKLCNGSWKMKHLMAKRDRVWGDACLLLCSSCSEKGQATVMIKERAGLNAYKRCLISIGYPNIL